MGGGASEAHGVAEGDVAAVAAVALEAREGREQELELADVPGDGAGGEAQVDGDVAVAGRLAGGVGPGEAVADADLRRRGGRGAAAANPQTPQQRPAKAAQRRRGVGAGRRANRNGRAGGEAATAQALGVSLGKGRRMGVSLGKGRRMAREGA